MIIAVGISVLFFGLILLVRNELVYRARQRALNYTSQRAQEAIDRRQPWQHFYDRLDSFISYDKMLFQFHKWTYAQWYKGFEEGNNNESK